MDTDSGDIYSLSWSPALQTIYFGCQNTSLQWYNFNDMDAGFLKSSHGPSSSSDSLPSTISESKRMAAKHKFFNGNGRSGQATPPRPHMGDVPQPKGVLQVEGGNVIASEHYGYIYSMAILPSPHEGADHTRETDDVLLVTGSGDETVKVRATFCFLRLESSRSDERRSAMALRRNRPHPIAHIRRMRRRCPLANSAARDGIRGLPRRRRQNLGSGDAHPRAINHRTRGT